MAGVTGKDDNEGAVVPVAAGLATGVFLVIVFAVLFANSMPPAGIRFIHEGSSANNGYLYATMLNDLYLEEQTLEAIVLRGTTEELKDIPLTLVAIKNGIVRAGDGSYFIPEEQDDDQITLGLYYGKDGMNESAAVTISNYTPDDIQVHALVLAGYIHGEVQTIESRSTVYSPVISDPYDAAGATITSPQWVLAGDSLTAYIQGDFNADGYGTSACYSFGASSPQSGNPSSHCVNIQNTWLT
jgi:hypothetical protein